MTLQQQTIAVVDDDPSLLKALGRLLTTAGYRVELYGRAEDVIDGMRYSQAICVIIDCQLGCISGVELAKQLSAANFQLPVIFMTASEDDCIRQQAMAFGCVAYLQKPFLADDLLASIARADRLRANRNSQAAE